MCTKKVHGEKSCGDIFWFASKSTNTRNLTRISIYKNFSNDAHRHQQPLPWRPGPHHFRQECKLHAAIPWDSWRRQRDVEISSGCTKSKQTPPPRPKRHRGRGGFCDVHQIHQHRVAIPSASQRRTNYAPFQCRNCVAAEATREAEAKTLEAIAFWITEIMENVLDLSAN